MNSNSYGRVILAFYIKMVKGILALSPMLLGAQSNTRTILGWVGSPCTTLSFIMKKDNP